MVQLRPFAAFRPPAALVERVACPPYDVISTAEARAFAQGNADSFLRVTRPEIDLPEGTDEHAHEVYATGARNLLELCERRVLVRDAEPHLYVYAESMGGHDQVGVVGCASVRDYQRDRIRKHEKTRQDKEDDRAKHIEWLCAHDEPVFLTYRASALVDRLVGEAMGAGPPVYDFSVEGVRHRLWPVGRELGARIEEAFGSEVELMYVADGHHRSAAASRVHERLRGDGREHDVFMAVVVPHDQVRILAYNRLVRDPEKRTPAELLERLEEIMDIEPTEQPQPDWPQTFGFYLGGRWYRGQARPHSFDPANPVALLDCAILQMQVLEPVFGVIDPRRADNLDFVGGVHGAAELARRVDAGQADLAIYLHPTKVDQVMDVSDAGRMMPPKSTWFEPKLRSGLFVHTF